MFSTVAHWYYNAILALTSCVNFDTNVSNTVQTTAQRLNITIPVARDAFLRLSRLGLLVEKTQKWTRAVQNQVVIPQIPANFIREHHKQHLEKAKIALDTQDLDAREFIGLTVSTDLQKIPEVKKRLRQFHLDMLEFLGDGEHTSVYQMSTQFFRLDENAPEN